MQHLLRAQHSSTLLTTHRTVDLLAQHAHLYRTIETHVVGARVVDVGAQLVPTAYAHLGSVADRHGRGQSLSLLSLIIN